MDYGVQWNSPTFGYDPVGQSESQVTYFNIWYECRLGISIKVW